MVLSEPDCRIYASFKGKNRGDHENHDPSLAPGSQSQLAEWKNFHPSDIKDIIDSYFVNNPEDQRPIPYESYQKAKEVSSSVKPDVLGQTVDSHSMAEVRRKYEGTDQWMKAPGGELVAVHWMGS